MSRFGRATLNVAPRPGSLFTETVPPIASVSSFTIARPEAGADGAVLCVAAVEEEPLEGVRELVRGEARPGVRDRELAGARGHGHRPAARRRAQRVLDQVREHLQRPVGVGDGGGGAVRVADEADADAHRLGPVPLDRLVHDAR